jgi:hypothetical protein
MRMNGSCARSVGTLVAGLMVLAAGVSAQTTDVDAILGRVAARLGQYYKRVQSIVCTERVTAQPVAADLSPFGFARVLEYELRVEPDALTDGESPTDAKVVRELRKVNGRAPRPRDKEGCYDPNPLSAEPLAFLLPANRHEYAFSLAGFGKGKDQRTFIVEFRSLERGKPDLKDDERGREGCFNISLPGATKGRIWVDIETHDVLRMEEHLASRVDVRVPLAMQRRHNLPDSLVIDRYDWAIRYKAYRFEDPSETLLLPESIETLAIMHGAQSHRKHQTFSDYRRFLTGARMVKEH